MSAVFPTGGAPSGRAVTLWRRWMSDENAGLRIDLSTIAQAIVVAIVLAGGGWTVNSINELKLQMREVSVLLKAQADDRADVAVRVRQLELSEARHQYQQQAPRQ